MLNFWKHKRAWGVWISSAVVLGFLFWTDPDRGASTRDMLMNLVVSGLGFTAAHILRKTYFDQVDMSKQADEAAKGSIGAGLVFLALVIFICVAALIFSNRAHAADVRTYVPSGANIYCPQLMSQKNVLWPSHADPAALCSLVEQESCITLTDVRCWNPKSQLKTAREEGAGMGQITRAYAEDGAIRFDTLAAVRALDPALAEWSWSNVYQRPDLQLRAVVVMNRDCFRRLSVMVKNPDEALRMCDAAYNGGYAGLQAERRACGLRDGCDPQRWFDQVELVCLKSKQRWNGYGASACEINRSHVYMVFRVRREKYLSFVS